MIPQFPEFKKLELSDKEEVEIFTKKVPPYSDYNFLSIWSWDVKGEVGVSQLHGNLVVRFNDYITGDPFYSFIGTTNVNETAHLLIGVAEALEVQTELKLITEETAKLIDDPDLLIVEDRDNFDYICDIDQLSRFEGGAFKQKRNEISSLLSLYPNIYSKEIDLKEPEVKKNIITLFHKWVNNKVQQGKDFEEHEESAFNKLLLLSDSQPLVAVGVYIELELVAFMICELEEYGYAVGHASKSDTGIKGTNAYLMKSMSEILRRYERRYFNYEQDLGLDSLRDGKSRFRPSFFLKKYKVLKK